MKKYTVTLRNRNNLKVTVGDDEAIIDAVENLEYQQAIIVSDIDNNSEDLTLSIISAPNWLGIDEFDLISISAL